MGGVEPKHEAIQEFAPPARAFDEEAVHGRRQPGHLDDLGQIRRALGRRTVEADLPPFRAARPQRQDSHSPLPL